MRSTRSLRAAPSPRHTAILLLGVCCLASAQTGPTPKQSDEAPPHLGAVSSEQDAQEQGSGSAQPGRLRRVEWPADPSTPAQPVRPLAPEVAQMWTERLFEPNLDLREQAFGELVEAALIDPSLAEFVRKRAQGVADDAWTWRMLRRELNSRQGSEAGRNASKDPFQGLLDSFGNSGPGAADASGWGPRSLDDWMRSLDPFLGARPGTPVDQLPRGLGIGGQGLLGGAGSTGQSVSVSQTPNGVRVEVHRTRDGQTESEVYEGENLEALKQAHPELQGLLGGGLRSPSSGLLDMRMGWPLGQNQRQTPKPSEPLRTDRLGVWTETVGPRPGALQGGCRIVQVLPVSLAQVLGLQAGDVLIELGGMPIRGAQDISVALGQREPGAELHATWVDGNGRRKTGSWRPSSEEGR